MFRINGDGSKVFYEGGKHTRTNRDFHNATNDFEQTASPDRDTMRARARWLHENNPIVSNIDDSLATNIIGGGLKFQFKTEDDALNKEIEAAWSVEKEILDARGIEHFDFMCSTILQNRFMDGETPLYLPIVKENGELKLKIQPIEVDRFALGYVKSENGSFFDGIETNIYGKPIRYHFQNNLFSKARIVGKQPSSDIAIDAKNMIYYYRPENRFTQYRGVSEYKQIIIDLKNFAAQMRATIESARARANIGYVVKQDGQNRSNAFVKDSSGDNIKEINGIFVKYLRPNEDITKLDPTVAGEDFKDFVHAVVRLIAAGRKISYELAFRDYTQVNYSSARAALLQDHKRFDREFKHFITYVYIPIFMRWLEIESLNGKFKNLTYSQFIENKALLQKAIKIYKPKREWVDPLKDARAIEIELQTCQVTLEDTYAAKGEDWEEKIEQISKERKRMIELGLDYGEVNREKADKQIEEEEDNGKN